MRLFATLLLILVTCACASHGATEARVRTALDVLKDVVNPAYRESMAACKREESLATDRYVGMADESGKDDYFAIKAHCHQLRDAFRAVRAAHGRAADLVESGALDEAEAEVARLRAMLRALDDGSAGGEEIL